MDLGMEQVHGLGRCTYGSSWNINGISLNFPPIFGDFALPESGRNEI